MMDLPVKGAQRAVKTLTKKMITTFKNNIAANHGPLLHNELIIGKDVNII